MPQQLGRIKYHNHALSSSSSNSNIKPWNEYKREQEVRFFKLQQLSRILKYHNHALSMKYSICNPQLLPLDLRKKAFDEFRLNMLIFMVSVTENFTLRLSLNINTGQKDSREVLETTFWFGYNIVPRVFRLFGQRWSILNYVVRRQRRKASRWVVQR